jgi:hypothetical protein
VVSIVSSSRDGDEGWEGLVKLCARLGVIPNRASKKIAIPCQAGDMLAWKTRITATNSLRYVGQMKESKEAHELAFIEASILNELRKRDGLMVRPVKTVFSLPKICVKHANLIKFRSAVALSR